MQRVLVKLFVQRYIDFFYLFMYAFYFTSYLITAGEDLFCTEGNELHFKWNLTRTELSTFSSKSVQCALKKICILIFWELFGLRRAHMLY